MDQVWINFLVSWSPFLLLILAWIWLVWILRSRSRAPSGRTIPELYEQQLDELKRHTIALERIAQALENRDRT